MSKNKDAVAEQQEERKLSGTTIVTGKTREEVAQKFEELKASAEGATLMAGAVGQKDDGTFELRIDIVNS